MKTLYPLITAVALLLSVTPACVSSSTLRGSNDVNPRVNDKVVGALADEAACEPRFPLSTRGRYIVDRCGNRFKLKSVNWAGASDQWEVVGGLDKQKLSDLVSGLKGLGFNSVRLPFSNDMLHPDNDKPAATRCKEKHNVECISATKNPDLVNKTAFQVYEAVVDELTKQGLAVILNNHTTQSKWCCKWDDNGLWISGQNLQRWQDDWVTMIERFKNNKAVVGADLRNEVRTGGSLERLPDSHDPNWHLEDVLDWRMAARDMGNNLLRKNPDILIVIEGINWQGVPGVSGFRPHLKPVENKPITLIRGDKLVYAAHNYGYIGPWRTNAPWETETLAGKRYAEMDKQTFEQTMTEEWGYVLDSDQPYTAPVWVSEFGSSYDEGSQQYKDWLKNLTDYMIDHDADWAYWVANASKLENTVRGEEEKYGLFKYPDWDSFHSNDWRLGDGPLGKLLKADGKTGFIDETRFLPMHPLRKSNLLGPADNNALDWDWKPGMIKISCPQDFRMVGLSENLTILCTNANASPARSGTREYKVVDGEASQLVYPPDWAARSVKYECPVDYYAVGVSYSTMVTGLLCEKNATKIPLNNRSPLDMWKADKRLSSSGGDWRPNKVKGQCADNQYLIGIAHATGSSGDYPAALLCSN